MESREAGGGAVGPQQTRRRTGIRDQIEAGFEAFGRSVYRRGALWLAALLVTGLLPWSQLGRLELDSSSRGFLADDDPIQVAYEAYRAEYGRDVPLLVVLEAPDVFQPEVLAVLAALHADLEREVPYLESVTSLVNAPAIGGREGILLVRRLEREWPGDGEALDAFRERVLADPIFRDRLVSADARFATVALKTEPYSTYSDPDEPARFITPEEDARILAAIASVIERRVTAPLEAHVVGAPRIALELQGAMRADMVRFSALSLVALFGLLGVLFRRVSGVAVPVAAVTMAAASTLGMMAWTGTPVRAPTQILPSFVLCVGVCGAVHLLVNFYRRFDAGQPAEAAIGGALRQCGLPIALTSLTTIAGLLSFRSAALAPIAEFGLFAPLGVAFAGLYTFVLIPSLLACVGPRPRLGRHHRPDARPFGAALARGGRFATSHPGTVIAASGAILALAALGLVRLSISHDPLTWFPQDNPVRVATERVDAAFRGSLSFEVLLETEQRNGLLDPELARRVGVFENEARAIETPGLRAGHVFSAFDVLQRVQGIVDPSAAANEPTRGQLLRNALLWKQAAPTGLGDWMDSRRSAARVSIRVPWVDAVHYPAYIAELRAALAHTVGNRATVEITGATAVMSQVVDAVLTSLVRSYGLALLLITPLIALLVGNWRTGVAAMVPNLAPLVATLGLMGWLGLPLDIFTLLVGCIAIGLAVDDTIHFMHGFERNYAESGVVTTAVSDTLHTTGRALLFTTLVLAAGFSVYTFSSLSHIGNFGFLMAFALGIAFLADVILAPALLAVFRDPRGVPSDGEVDAATAPLFETLRASARTLGCSPQWLEAERLPQFSATEYGSRGPVLVLLHGLFGAISNWQAVAPKFGKFARVVALDLPILEGDRSEITVQALTVYLEAFLRSRRLGPVTLCGNSMGGHVALRMTLQAPDLVASLVLTGSSGLYEHEPARVPLRPDRAFILGQMRRVFVRDEFITEARVREVLQALGSRGAILKVIQAARSAKLDNMQDCLHQVPVRTLLLWGEQDEVTPLEVAHTFEDLIPDATLHTVSHCGHAPMIEEPDWFADEVQLFLSKADRSA